MATTNRESGAMKFFDDAYEGGTVSKGRPAAGEAGRVRRGRISRGLFAVLCVAALCLAIGTAPALAHTVSLVVYKEQSIDGTGTTFINAKGEVGTGFYAGSQDSPYHFTNFIAGADINQANGHLLVLDDGYVWTGEETNSWQGIISQFTGAGSPTPFTALPLGVNAIVNVPGYNGTIAVDNSETGSAGNIYVQTGSSTIHAYDESGSELTGNFPLTISGACGIAVDPQGKIWIAERNASKVVQFDSGGSPTGLEISPGFRPCPVETDSEGNVYVGSSQNTGGTVKYDSSGNELFQYETTRPSGIGVDLVTGDVYISNSQQGVNAYKSDGTFIDHFGEEDPDHSFAGIGNATDITVNSSNHDIYVVDTRGGPFAPHYIYLFRATGEITVPDVTTGDADVTPTTAVLHGTINPDGLDTTDCHFQYGENTEYNEGSVPCAEGDVFTGSSDYQVSAEVTDLTPGTEYHFRLVANNENGISTPGLDQTFKPQGPPVVSGETVSDVNTDNVTLGADVDPSGLATTYRFEIGTDTSYGMNLPEPDGEVTTIASSETQVQIVGDTPATRLDPDTTYHFRVVATNAQGTTTGADHYFRTFPSQALGAPCPNAHARQQTGAAFLDDCRAYELVSPADAGGYDVQSDVILGQSVLTARPDAPDSVLYSLHFGKVPGVLGSPTNYGLDPYVASRSRSGWSTRYVGLPADGTPATEPFGSPLAGADGDLSAFAFGGSGLCSPCFADGTTGIPVHMPDGALAQGMKGSLDPGPGATQAGVVAKRLSDDGSHLVFGSTSKFEPDGNSNGDVTIYDRNLVTGTTHVVSKTPGGSTMTGSGIGELGMSADGSRIVVGKVLSSGFYGTYWHPYMNVGDSGSTIDLAPGATTGVVFNGISADGSKVFFTTRDKLVGGDTDGSTDLYRADVVGGSATLTLLSKGSGGGDTDTCEPVESFDSETWNNLAGSPSCDVLAFAGGAGVSASGTAYFLSPETLDGHGTQDEPNLFVAQPGGEPKFVATIEAESEAIHNALFHSQTHTFGDFQTTPHGKFGVFVSRLPLTGYPNAGHSEIYRYDVASDQLTCASCAPTRATATSDTELSQSGLNISDDGRVFFSSSEQLVLRDTNARRDAYEWSDGKIQLVSTGSDPANSGLLSVSADGVNAYFFTRATLVPEDGNGTAMKIYDAREGGGFPTLPPPVPCQASDECHGAGSQAAPPVSVATLRGHLGNVPSESCNGRKLAHRAKWRSRRARQLRHRAARLSRRAGGSRKSRRAVRRYRKQAKRLSRGAKKDRRAAKRCRRQSRGSK